MIRTAHLLLEAVNPYFFVCLFVVAVLVVVVQGQGHLRRRHTAELHTFLPITPKPPRTMDVTYTQQQLTKHCAPTTTHTTTENKMSEQLLVS